MQQINDQLLLTTMDYEIIMGHLRSGLGKTKLNWRDAEELQLELNRAKLVAKNDIPGDVVRLNSFVVIQDEKEGKKMEFTIVTPEKANIKEKKISILSPIGTALIGYRKGNKVCCKVPSGKRTFAILDVINSFS